MVYFVFGKMFLMLLGKFSFLSICKYSSNLVTLYPKNNLLLPPSNVIKTIIISVTFLVILSSRNQSNNYVMASVICFCAGFLKCIKFLYPGTALKFLTLKWRTPTLRGQLLHRRLLMTWRLWKGVFMLPSREISLTLRSTAGTLTMNYYFF